MRERRMMRTAMLDRAVAKPDLARGEPHVAGAA
jgi:hypothetical protein